MAVMLASLMEGLDKEIIVVVAMNTKNKVIGVNIAGIGHMAGCHVDTSGILRFILLSSCTQFIIAHNHPSGDPTPSPDDIRITKKLQDAAQLLDITLLDHIIFGEGKICSLKKHNLL
jgi:DNA repair protein RadC